MPRSRSTRWRTLLLATVLLFSFAKQLFASANDLLEAGGAEHRHNDPVPHRPDFASPAWRKLYRHTLHEVARLGLELSLNIQSGWNLGGPPVIEMVDSDHATTRRLFAEIPPAQRSGKHRLKHLVASLPDPIGHPLNSLLQRLASGKVAARGPILR